MNLALLILKYICGLIISIPWLSVSMILGLFSREQGFKNHQIWAKTILHLLGIHLTVVDHNQGIYNQPPYVFVLLNQTSLSESFIIIAAMPRPTRIIANLEYALIPFLGWFVASTGNVIIRRNNSESSQRGFLRSKTLLKEGVNMALSIEGYRSPDGQLQEFKRGPVIMALATHARIIPFFIKGAREILPVGEWQMRAYPAEVTFFPAIETSQMRIRDSSKLLKSLRQLAEDTIKENQSIKG